MSNEKFPDRLCINPKSPYYDEAVLARGVGIRFNGAEKTNVAEYCVSEGWVRVTAGKTVDRRGDPMTVKLKGTVEPYHKPEFGTSRGRSERQREHMPNLRPLLRPYQ